MKNPQQNLSKTVPKPWLAFSVGLLGCGVLVGSNEPMFKFFGLASTLVGAGLLFHWSQKTRDLLDQILEAIPLPDKSESVLTKLPKAWSELEQENQALKAQSQREDQLRLAILTNLKVGLVLFSREKRVRLFNPAARQLLGTSSHLEENGDLLGVFREPESLRHIDKSFRGEATEWNLYRGPRILHVRAVPFAIGEMPERGVLITVDDITRQEALETTRQKFISNASHELKTPTTSIRLAAENLLEGKLVHPEGEPSLQSIFRSVDRMTMLLYDISELSRIETGALNLQPQSIELGAFLNAFMDEVNPQAKARNLELRSETQVGIEKCVFQTDPLRLHQLLENLLSNAIKFSPEASEVLVRVWKDGPWLAWSIIDHGPGISPSDAQRIFERFYRAPTARGVPGTGLGLSIVKHLSALMGGEVSLESELGKGATFTLRLPMAETTS